MSEYRGPANQWFRTALAELQTAEVVTARGRVTRELLHTTVRLPDPRCRVLTIPFRRANPFFQAAETVWILAGRADAGWIMPYNSRLGSYLDPGNGFFHGAYGERLRRWGTNSRLGVGGTAIDQLTDVVTQLREDPGSRRAVAVLHHPQWDRPSVQTVDRPCNIALSFQLRNGRLWMATFNRSNDFILGLTYTNLVQFTTIQEYVASELGAEVGEYTHFSSSLHVYQDDPTLLRLARIAAPDFDVYQWFRPEPMAPGAGPSSLAQLSSGALDWESIRCPYWASIGRMLEAWSELRRADAGPNGPAAGLRRALRHLAAMTASDWMVAAMEFTHRWAQKRGVGTEFTGTARAMFDRITQPELRRAVLAYVFHDTGVEL